MPALIFDLDGTLVDTVYAHVFAWQRALAERGMAIDGWRIHRRIGMSGGLFTRAVGRELGRTLGEDEAHALQDRHGALFRELLPERHPLPGARELLAALRAAGVVHGIATSGRRPEIDASLDVLGVPADAVVDPARRRRPREARARPLPRVRPPPGCRRGGLLRRRRRGLGPARRAPRGDARHRAAVGRLRRRRAHPGRRVPRLPRRGRAARRARRLGVEASKRFRGVSEDAADDLLLQRPAGA